MVHYDKLVSSMQLLKENEESVLYLVVAIGLASCDMFNVSGGYNFTGEELFDAFKTQSFEGSSGSEVFDPVGYSGSQCSELFVEELLSSNQVNGRASVRTLLMMVPMMCLQTSQYFNRQKLHQCWFEGRGIDLLCNNIYSCNWI